MYPGAYAVRDETTVAEITQALKTRKADVYGITFRDTVVKNFPSGEPSQLIFFTKALGPYFRNITLDEVSRKQLLKAQTFLHPDEVPKPVSAHSLLYVARKLLIATQKDVLVDEFKLVQLSRLSSELGRIHDKWNNVIQGGKYSNLSEVIKNALEFSAKKEL